MRAIDTNVVVRLMVRDDADLLAVARTIVTAPFMILPTVVLEAEWVLRSSYRLSPAEIAGRLSRLLGNENAVVVSSEALHWALARMVEGADFADALHIALAAEAEALSFATFDRGAAGLDGDTMTVELLTPEN